MKTKISIIPTNKYSLLNLTGQYIHKKNKKTNEIIYKFDTYNNGMITSKDVYRLYAPSNDEIFKILFNGNYNINKCNGFQRAKSLIESLLNIFPNKNFIKKMEYWPNEIPNLKGHNKKGLKVLDCPFLCKMNDGKEYLVDLKMQNYYYEGIDLNALTYGTSLRNASNKPVIIILLLYKESKINNSFIISPHIKFLNESKYKKIDDYVEVICFDLLYILYCIINDEEPELNGFGISEEGKKWVKLLTIKEWMNACDFYKKRFPIPKELVDSKEIISALIILGSDNNAELTKLTLKEKEENMLIENTEKGHSIQIWIDGFLKNLEVNNALVPFPDVAPEFLIKNCKKKLDRTNCILFLRNLIEKKIIKSKQIYEEIINSLYD